MFGIVDESQRGLGPQPPCARRVPAARHRLRRCRSSTMEGHRRRRGALQPAPRRTERARASYPNRLLTRPPSETHDIRRRAPADADFRGPGVFF